HSGSEAYANTSSTSRKSNGLKSVGLSRSLWATATQALLRSRDQRRPAAPPRNLPSGISKRSSESEAKAGGDRIHHSASPPRRIISDHSRSDHSRNVLRFRLTSRPALSGAESLQRRRSSFQHAGISAGDRDPSPAGRRWRHILSQPRFDKQAGNLARAPNAAESAHGAPAAE